MKWIELTTAAQLEKLTTLSASTPQVIFKYSSRCSLSDMIKERLEMSDAPADIDFYFLNLIKYRSLSNKIAEDFHIRHESPQVLLVKNGECIYDESHNSIRMDEIVAQSMAA